VLAVAIMAIVLGVAAPARMRTFSTRHASVEAIALVGVPSDEASARLAWRPDQRGFFAVEAPGAGFEKNHRHLLRHRSRQGVPDRSRADERGRLHAVFRPWPPGRASTRRSQRARRSCCPSSTGASSSRGRRA